MSSPRPRLRSTLVVALLAGLSLPFGATRAAVREDWFMAARNHVEARISVLIATDESGRQWVRTLDLWQLGIPVPAVETWRHSGEVYVPLSELDAAVSFDTVSQWIHFNDPKPPAQAAATDEIIVDVVVNRQTLPEPYVLEQREGVPWLPPVLIEDLRLAIPRGKADAGGWVPVTAIAGQNYLLAADRMILEFTVAPEGFVEQRLDGRRSHRPGALPATESSVPALIVRYDANVGNTNGDPWSSLLLDAGMSAGNTYCSSKHLWRDGRATTRIGSHCTMVWPAQRRSLSIGDTSSRGSSLGGSVSYGGFRLGTDFGLQPYFLTQPLLGIEGTARLPSVLEVWTDQQLSMRTEVAPGNFIIDGLPALSGSGQIRAVVTDILGRQTVLSVPFYSDPMLLKPGLVDWSIEGGRLRLGAGTPEDQYADRFGLGYVRAGIRPWWTAGGSIEIASEHRRAGVDSFLRLGKLGVLETSLSANETRGRHGRAWMMGYSYRGRRWSFAMRELRRNGHHADLAWLEPGSAPTLDRQAGLTLQLGAGTVSLGAIQQVTGAGDDRSFLRAGLGMPTGRGHLFLSAMKDLGGGGHDGWMVMWFLPLGDSSVSAWVEAQDGRLAPGVSLQRSQPRGAGYGYRLAWQDFADGEGRVDADLRWRSGHASGAVRAQRSRGLTAANASLSGAILWAGGEWGTTSEADGAFALVTLPAAGVGITHDNQVVGRTGRDGSAIIPGLRPYEVSRLGLVAEEVPLDVQLEKSDIELVAGHNQVVRADFRASARRAATFRVLDGHGNELPPGATARTGREGAQWPLGYGGLLYLEWEGELEGILIERAGKEECRIAFPGSDPMPAPEEIMEVQCLAVAS